MASVDLGTYSSNDESSIDFNDLEAVEKAVKQFTCSLDSLQNETSKDEILKLNIFLRNYNQSLNSNISLRSDLEINATKIAFTIVKKCFEYIKSTKYTDQLSTQVQTDILEELREFLFEASNLNETAVNLVIEYLSQNTSETFDFDFIHAMLSDNILISQIKLEIDIYSTSQSWKCLHFLIIQCPELKMVESQLLAMSKCILEHLKILIPQLIEESETDFEKDFKFTNSLVSLVQLIVDKFRGQYSVALDQFFRICLLIEEFCEPSLKTIKIDDSRLEKLRQHLVVKTDFTRRALLEESNIQDVLLRYNFDLNISPFTYVKYLLNTIRRLMASENSVTLWSTRVSQTIFGKILECIDDCFYDVILLILPSTSNFNKKISAYQYTLEILSSFIAATPKSYFEPLEEILYKKLLFGKFTLSLISTDLLVFLNRIVSPKLRLDQCILLANLSQVTSDLQYTRVVSLLRRNIQHLSPENKQEFIAKFSIKEYPYIWNKLNLYQEVEVFENIEEHHKETEMGPMLITDIFFCLKTSKDVNYIKNLSSRILSILFNEKCIHDKPAIVQECIESCMNLLNDDAILKLSETLQDLDRLNNDDNQIIILHMLQSYGKFENSNEKFVLKILCNLCRNANGFYATILVLKYLNEYSKKVVDKSIIPDIIGGDPEMKESFKNFLVHNTDFSGENWCHLFKS